jgi:uncharacterized membrane protein YoaK (UPF0700 family)
VPDLTTTLLPLTITGISADSTAAGGKSSKIGRRFVSIASMFAGAVIGTLLIRAEHTPLVLVVALGLLLAVVVVSAVHRRSVEEWTRPVLAK